MRKRSGNVSFGSPAGCSHFSISQQVSPACFPILSNPVKLIIKRLQQRPSLLTPSILPVWSIYSPNPTTTAEWKFAQKAAFSYYSFRKSSKSISPPIGSAIPTSLLPDITGARSWQRLEALLPELKKENCLQAKYSTYKGKITSTPHSIAIFKFRCFFWISQIHCTFKGKREQSKLIGCLLCISISISVFQHLNTEKFTFIMMLEWFSLSIFKTGKVFRCPPETTSSEENEEQKLSAVLPKIDWHSFSKQQTRRGA